MSKGLKTFLCVLLSLVIIVGVAVGAYYIGKKGLIKKPDSEQKQEQTEKDGLEVEQTQSTGGVTFVSAKINPSQYEEYGIMPIADSAYTLTATLTPSDVSNKKVDFTAAWSNGASSWASGKSVSDYVTVTQATDGALQATLTCKQAFGEKIVVTCKSRANTSATATADLHYKQRITAYTLKITSTGNSLSYSSAGTKAAAYKADFNSTLTADITVGLTKSTVYTKENTTDTVTEVKFTPTDGFRSAITKTGLSANTVQAKTERLLDLSGSLSASLRGFLDKTFWDAIHNDSATNRNKLITAIAGFSATAYDIALYNDDSKVADFTLTIDSSVITGQKTVERVELNDTVIEF